MGHLFAMLITAAPPAAMATIGVAAPQAVTVSVDQDLLVLMKGIVLGGSIFLAVFAFIGVAFFGWDVRKARASLADAQKETRELLQELKTDFNEMKILKEKLEQLGAQLEESGSQEPKEPKEPPSERAVERSSTERIRDVIRTSNYEWTTIGRITKRTGLTRDEVLNEFRKASDIIIGNGSQTQDFIFKLKSAA